MEKRGAGDWKAWGTKAGIRGRPPTPLSQTKDSMRKSRAAVTQPWWGLTATNDLRWKGGVQPASRTRGRVGVLWSLEAAGGL